MSSSAPPRNRSTRSSRANTTSPRFWTRLAYDDLKGAQNLIQNDQYPVMARDFNRTLEQFPANLIAGLFGVEPLNTFGW